MSSTTKEGMHRMVRGEILVLMLGAVLAGCGGGGGGSDAPTPTPTPTPPPPPPPSGGNELPPVSSTVVNLNDNHRVGAIHWQDGSTDQGGNGQAVAGLDCIPNLPETYHVHTHVTVYLNGEALAVPLNIGIPSGVTPRCFYPIHTHDHSGKIHMEAAAPATFTFGQLIQIWGITVNGTTFADLTGMPVVVYVTDNGTVTRPAESTWPNIEMTSHREITVQVGTPITEIPQYSWNGD